MTSSPDYAVPTGEFVSEWLDENAMNAAELSRRLGVSRKHVSELIRGKAPLSHDLALRLEAVTGVPARRWNQLEALYQEDRARLEADARLATQYERARAFPLAYLRKVGVVERGTRDKSAVVRSLVAFLGVADLDAWQRSWCDSAVAYRRSAVRRQSPETLSAWLTLGESAVDVGGLPPFDVVALRELLPSLRALSRDDPATYVGRAVEMLATVGVGLCFVPAVPGFGVYGATRWLRGHPIVQLSLRGKTDDQLWFTLFHELGHVLLHPRDGLYLADDEDAAEAEADSFAADLLIPPEAAARLPNGRNKTAVVAFAEEIGVAPGVVLGRIHRVTGDYAWGHDLKVTFEFTYPGRSRD